MRAWAVAFCALFACSETTPGASEPNSHLGGPDAPQYQAPPPPARPPLAYLPGTAEAPKVACGGDAAVLCELPPSVCVDFYHLAYFTGGTCVDGQCRYDVHYMQCPNGCIRRGCIVPFT